MKTAELADLVELLSQEVDLLEKLHSVLVSQQEALVEGDVERISALVEEQISVLNLVGEVEARRKALLAACGSDEGKPIRIDALIDIAPDYLATRLSSIRTALREVIEAIGKVNSQNGMLINQSLAYIDNTIKMIAGEDQTSTVYTPNGEVTRNTGQIAIDRTV